MLTAPPIMAVSVHTPLPDNHRRVSSISQLLSSWPSTKSPIVLREHLMSSTTSISPPRDLDTMHRSSPGSPSDQPGGDLGPAGSSVLSNKSDSDGGENGADGRKGYGKRELSTSKRAAQNRAAQRAFRQRKEGYIKKLEEQVRDYAILNENYKNIQAENHQLRDYIISLQSRLLESQGEIPPPPGNVDGLQPDRSGHVSRPVLPGLPPTSHTRSDPFTSREAPRPVPEPSYRFADTPSAAKRAKTGHGGMGTAQDALQSSANAEATAYAT